MADAVKPEVERRKKETGLFAHVAETLIGKQSRKVAFGIWLFIVANGFKARTDMPWDTWWKCVLLSGALIGLGTILDEIVMTFGSAIAKTAASKVGAIVSTESTIEKTSTVVQQ